MGLTLPLPVWTCHMTSSMAGVFGIKRQVTGLQGINICACCNLKPVEALKRKDGRDTLQFDKCNAGTC